MSEPAPFHTQTDTRLAELADALGIPVGWFYEGHTPSFASDAFALIRLYAAITDAQGRQRAMNFVRREAERCEASRDHFP